MTLYIETASDYAFTLWLATRNSRTVMAERHNGLSRPERQMLAAKRARKPKPPPIPPPVKKARQAFTDSQIQTALAALAARENNTSRSK